MGQKSTQKCLKEPGIRGIKEGKKFKYANVFIHSCKSVVS